MQVAKPEFKPKNASRDNYPNHSSIQKLIIIIIIIIIIKKQASRGTN